jgi:hypothetical protein
MLMYVNYYTCEMMDEGDNPPIGILLCADKSESVEPIAKVQKVLARTTPRRHFFSLNNGYPPAFMR